MLKTLETALSDAKKGVEIASQQESKCTEAHEVLASHSETIQLIGLRWRNSDNSPEKLMS